MADINAVDLTAETLSSLDGTENVVGFDTAEGKKIPISVLADYAIQSKTQTLAGSTQTPKAAIDALNTLKAITPTGYASLSDLQSALVTFAGTVGGGKSSLFAFSATATFSPFTNGVTYSGYMYVVNANPLRFSLLLSSQTAQAIKVGYNNGTWRTEELPTRAEMNVVNARGNALRFTISNASTDVIDTNYINPIIVSQGSVATTYGTYFVVLRIDSAADGASCYIVRHNSAGYQISKIYEGTASNTPVITSDGVVKLLSSSNSVTVHGYYLKLAGWS